MPGTFLTADLKAFSRLLQFFCKASLDTLDRYSSLFPLYHQHQQTLSGAVCVANHTYTTGRCCAPPHILKPELQTNQKGQTALNSMQATADCFMQY